MLKRRDELDGSRMVSRVAAITRVEYIGKADGTRSSLSPKQRER